MKIPLRLEKIISYINSFDKVADIGCDHGYLGMGCLKKGVVYLQNIDNKVFPLSSAKRNLNEFERMGNIMYTLSDGLEKLDSSIDTIVISGMGGNLIADILMKDLDKTLRLKKIIVEANTKIVEFREIIQSNFKIVNEDMVKDKGKIYEIMILVPSAEKVTLEYYQCLLGPILLQKRSPLFLEKWERRLDELLLIVKDEKDPKFAHLIDELNCLKEYIK